MEKISVVIPTYNRGHLLEQILPSYFQEEVGEVIVVDDCSEDNTYEVIKKMKKKYSTLKYLKLKKNSKQVVAKNEGIKLANYNYIYFGDDDSFLAEKTIYNLLKILQEKNIDIVGAKALYMESEKDLEDIEKFIKKFNLLSTKNWKELVNFDKMYFNFKKSVEEPILVPCCQACFLIKTEIAKKNKFDEMYKGNCYREETDYLLNLYFKGYKIMYTSKGIQINFPRILATGGSHVGNDLISKLKWLKSAIDNNNYFVNKNYLLMKKYKLVSKSKISLKINFIMVESINIIKAGMKKMRLKWKKY